MPLVLHAHPLSSFCQKVLVALHELEVPFEFRLLDLSDASERAAHLARWPKGKMPVLEDPDTGMALPETSIIIEWLDRRAGGSRLLPGDPDARLEVRLWDRISDLYVMLPMQRAVAARIAHGDTEPAARTKQEVGDELEVAYGLLEARLAGRARLGGDAFSMADCAAIPALFYASAVRPFEPGRPALAAYFRRMLERPSVARVLQEAAPWFQYFPLVASLPAEYRPPAA